VDEDELMGALADIEKDIDVVESNFHKVATLKFKTRIMCCTE
jgi:hypothetical protein